MNPRFPAPVLERTSKTIRASAVRTLGPRSEVAVRGFRFDVDQPVSMGGLDEAPTPMEYLAGAVNACFGVVVDAVARERGIPIRGLSTYAIARQDRRGLAGSAPVQPYFHRYRLEAILATPCREVAALRELAAQVERRCPALNLIVDAHVEVTLAWSFADRVAAVDAEAAANRALGYPAAGTSDAPQPFLAFESDARVSGVSA